jgi:glycosyltransferase involved in cell wall biosynthesis
LNQLKKILLLTDGTYPFVMGGMQKHSYYLAKYLTLKGIDVTLVHCSEQHLENELKHVAFDTFDKSKIKAIHFKFPKLDNLPGHYIRESAFYSEAIFNSLQNQLNQFDAIYAQGFTGWTFVKNKNTFTAPVFVNFHGYEMFQKAPSLKLALQHNFLKNPVKEITTLASYVYSFGGKISEILHSIKIDSSKIVECPIGIEESWLNKHELSVNSKRTFVFVGRYERRKGIEELNKAIQKLGTANYKIHCIGPIPENKKLIADNVIYHGPLADTEAIKAILTSSDVLVCPSYSEGMPTVIMEAMACGLAILATDVGAVSKQVDNSNGILLNELSVKNLTRAMQQFISMNDEELLSKKNVSLQRVKDHFLWTNVIDIKIKQIKERLKN